MNSSRCTLSLLRVGGWLLLFPLVLASACVQVDCANGDLSCNPLALAAYLRTPDPDCLVRGQTPTEGWLGFSGINTDDDQGRAVCGLPNGGLVVAAIFKDNDSAIQGLAPLRPFSGASGNTNVALLVYDEFGRLERYAYYGAASVGINVLDLAIGPDGSIYIVGNTEDDISPIDGVVPLSAHSGPGNEEAYLMRFAPDLRLEWYRFIGGAGTEIGTGVAIGDDGSVLVGGRSGANFTIDGRAPLIAHSGNSDIFLARFAADGQLLWHTNLGSAGNEIAERLRRVNVEPIGSGLSDAADQFVVAASFNSDVPVLAGRSPSRAYAGGNDAVYLRVDRGGQLLSYSFYGGPGNQFATNILGLRSGTVLLTGSTNEDLPVLDGSARQGAYVAGTDGLALWLNADGSVQNHRIVGGTGAERINTAAESPAGDIWLTADLNSNALDSLSPYAHSGGADVTVLRLSPTGVLNRYVYYGGSGGDFSVGAAPTQDGGLILTGGSEAPGSDFSLEEAAVFFDPHSIGSADVFLLRVLSNGRTVPD